MSKKKKWVAGAAALAVAAALALLALSYRPSLPGGRLVVLFTQELRGHPVPCGCYQGQPGGLARLPAVAGADFGSRSTLLLDAGDFMGSPRMRGFDDPDRPGLIGPEKREYLKARTLALARMMGRLGISAACPGEQDFMLGQPFLLSDLRDPPGAPPIWAPRPYPFVCANLLLSTGDPLFPPYRILRIGRGSLAGLFHWGGVRVGVTGLLSPSLPIRQDRREPYALTVGEAAAAARGALEEMRGRGADVVVVLFHGPWSEVGTLLRAVPGIDLVIAGHDGAPRLAREPGSGWAAQLNPGGVEAGRIVLTITGGRAVDATFQRLPFMPEIPQAPRVLAPYLEFQARLAASPPPPPRLEEAPEPFAGSTRCRDCHGREFDHWRGPPHASAFRTLVDKGHPGDPECLQCHVTGWGRRTGYGSPGSPGGLDAIGCETCHGPRARHAGDREARRKSGENLPEAKLRPDAQAPYCAGCHDDARDPGFKNNHERRFERIRHR